MKLTNLLPAVILASTLSSSMALAMGERPVENHGGSETVVNPSTEDLVKNEKFLDAYLHAQREIKQAERTIGVNDIVARSSVMLEKVYQETVTARSKSSSSNSVLAWLVAVVSKVNDKTGERENSISLVPDQQVGNYSSSSTSTKMILQNPAEVAAFPMAVTSDGKRLEKEILSHVEKNSEAILNMKLQGILAMKAAYEMKRRGQASLITIGDLQSMIASLQSIRFLGEQTVKLCVRKNYIDVVRYQSNSSLTSSILGQISSSSYSDEGVAHVVNSCEQSSNQFAKSPGDTLLAADFTQLDRILDEWMRTVYVAYLFGNLGAEPQATFNNPYLK